MTDSDRLVALTYAGSTHTLDTFLSRYEECLLALKDRQSMGSAAGTADETAAIGDSLGGPA